MYFLIADELLIFDRVAQTITILVNAVLDEKTQPAGGVRRGGRRNRTAGFPSGTALANTIPVDVPSEVPEMPFESNVPKGTFSGECSQSKKYITGGDIIQVVGSQRFSTPVTAAPLDIYRAARSINPSPYMFLLELEGFSLVGASPEIHVRCEDGRWKSGPSPGRVAGAKRPRKTRPWQPNCWPIPRSGPSTSCWWTWRATIWAGSANYGSVQVKDLMIIERYSHVMHIVSQVEGTLSPERTAYDLMRATFPAGTLSGAPKIRAMQIICRTGTNRARALRRLRGLFFLQRQSRLLHHHPHRAAQGRQGLRAGRRRLGQRLRRRNRNFRRRSTKPKPCSKPWPWRRASGKNPNRR